MPRARLRLDVVLFTNSFCVYLHSASRAGESSLNNSFAPPSAPPWGVNRVYLKQATSRGSWKFPQSGTTSHTVSTTARLINTQMRKIASVKLQSWLLSSVWDLLCVSVWMGPPIHRLAAKLEDFRASLSLTSSSTRCRSRDASDCDSSSKSPASFREISSQSPSGTVRPFLSVNDKWDVSEIKWRILSKQHVFSESQREWLDHCHHWRARQLPEKSVRFYYIHVHLLYKPSSDMWNLNLDMGAPS